MNTSIIGCKYFNDYQILKWHLDEIEVTQITICGDGDIDKLATRYAKENNIKLVDLWPGKQSGWIYLWKEYYRLVVTSDVLLAFWFGDSNSVLSMINKAKQMKKEVIIIRGYHPDANKSSGPQRDHGTTSDLSISSQPLANIITGQASEPVQGQSSQQTQLS